VPKRERGENLMQVTKGKGTTEIIGRSFNKIENPGDKPLSQGHLK